MSRLRQISEFVNHLCLIDFFRSKSMERIASDSSFFVYYYCLPNVFCVNYRDKISRNGMYFRSHSFSFFSDIVSLVFTFDFSFYHLFRIGRIGGHIYFECLHYNTYFDLECVLISQRCI